MFPNGSQDDLIRVAEGLSASPEKLEELLCSVSIPNPVLYEFALDLSQRAADKPPNDPRSLHFVATARDWIAKAASDTELESARLHAYHAYEDRLPLMDHVAVITHSNRYRHLAELRAAAAAAWGPDAKIDFGDSHSIAQNVSAALIKAEGYSAQLDKYTQVLDTNQAIAAFDCAQSQEIARESTLLSKLIYRHLARTSSTRFDVFVSYNSTDRQSAFHIANRLREGGLAVWLDDWEILAGDVWQEKLEAGLRASKSIAVLVGPERFGRWQTEEFRAAIELAVSDRQIRCVPVLLPGVTDSIWADLPLLLKRRTVVQFHANLNEEEAWDRLLKATAPPSHHRQKSRSDSLSDVRRLRIRLLEARSAPDLRHALYESEDLAAQSGSAEARELRDTLRRLVARSERQEMNLQLDKETLSQIASALGPAPATDLSPPIPPSRGVAEAGAEMAQPESAAGPPEINTPVSGPPPVLSVQGSEHPSGANRSRRLGWIVAGLVALLLIAAVMIVSLQIRK